jgi:toxin-antitoxin system PIN domain toxin
MKVLPDSNVWLALTIEVHAQHWPVMEWFTTFPESGSMFFNRSSQQSFLRLLTTAAVWTPYQLRPLSNSAAWSVYQDHLSRPQVLFLDEYNGTEDLWKRFAARSTSSPKLWMDAYLAAFAASAGLILVTTDRAFTQFKGCDVQLIS